MLFSLALVLLGFFFQLTSGALLELSMIQLSFFPDTETLLNCSLLGTSLPGFYVQVYLIVIKLSLAFMQAVYSNIFCL